MRHTKESAQLVLQLVTGEILLRTALRQIIVRQRAGPHDGSPVTIVLRILQHLWRRLHHRPQQCLGNGIRQQRVLILREVALHRVHHDVGGSSSRLIGRQRISALRVHDGKLTTAEVAVHATLQHSLVVGDHTARRHLRACSRDGEHHADGQARLWHGLPVPEIPHVARIPHAVADGLRRVDHATATHSEDEVHLLLLTERYTLLHLREQRIGHYPTQLYKADACLGEHLLHLI